MSVFNYLKDLWTDDELTTDFLDYSLKSNKFDCAGNWDNLFAYCGPFAEKYKRMKYISEVFLYFNTKKSYEQKKRLFTTLPVEYSDIFSKKLFVFFCG